MVRDIGATGGGAKGRTPPPLLISTLLKMGEVKCEIILGCLKMHHLGPYSKKISGGRAPPPQWSSSPPSLLQIASCAPGKRGREGLVYNVHFFSLFISLSDQVEGRGRG